MKKPLDEAVNDFSAMREGAAIHVIEITKAPAGSGFNFNCDQASFSGELADTCKESEVLLALVQTLEATCSYYHGLLAQAVMRERASRDGH